GLDKFTLLETIDGKSSAWEITFPSFEDFPGEPLLNGDAEQFREIPSFLELVKRLLNFAVSHLKESLIPLLEPDTKGMPGNFQALFPLLAKRGRRMQTCELLLIPAVLEAFIRSYQHPRLKLTFKTPHALCLNIARQRIKEHLSHLLPDDNSVRRNWIIFDLV